MATVQTLPPASGVSARSAALDPLADDEASDGFVLTTKRAIGRVALVAGAVAARFERERLPHDPMAWMLAPRRMFGGAAALEACLSRDACARAVLLHGLSIGLDADPAAIEALLDDGGEDGDGGIGSIRDAGEPRGPVVPNRRPPRGELRLFTATVVADDGLETVQAFHASLAVDEAEIAGRLYMRMGAAMADAVIREGFDPTAPLVAALVAPALCDTLAMVAADPSSPLAAGLDLNVEQRFLN